MIIQAAQNIHAEATCELIYQSGPVSFDYIFNQKHGPEVRVFLRHLFRTRKTMFSHKHHLVCLDKDQVIASIGRFSLKSHHQTFWTNACSIFLHYGWRSIVRGIRFEKHLVKPPKKDCLYLCHIAVTPEYRGKGIASRMIQHLKDEAKDNGLRALSLDVAQNNQTALNVYLSLGFKIVSIQESYNDILDNHIYMEMPL